MKSSFGVAREWFRQYGRGTFVSWDFALAAVFGFIAFGLSWNKAVRTNITPVLITEGAVGVAITATVFSAVAVFATFYDAAYRKVLDSTPGGFRAALMPYVVIGVVATFSGLTAIVGAIALPALNALPVALVVGMATLLCAWSLTGTASLIEVTLFHATQRAALLRGADEADSVRARRLARRSAS